MDRGEAFGELKHIGDLEHSSTTGKQVADDVVKAGARENRLLACVGRGRRGLGGLWGALSGRSGRPFCTMSGGFGRRSSLYPYSTMYMTLNVFTIYAPVEAVRQPNLDRAERPERRRDTRIAGIVWYRSRSDKNAMR